MKRLYALLLFSLSITVVTAQTTYTDFVFTVKTDLPGVSNDSAFKITVPHNVTDFKYNFKVDWENDGVFDDSSLTKSITHQYDSIGSYTIRINGEFPKLNFGPKTNTPPANTIMDCEKLISVEQWGTYPWKNLDYAFAECKNLNFETDDKPNLDSVTSLVGMFRSAKLFNGNIGDWDMSHISNLRFMFYEASSFNSNVGHWNVSNVKDMFAMFDQATSFNQNISNWDVSNVTDMGFMFRGASNFNQSIDNWNVAHVTNMERMFARCPSFDQELRSWNVSSVENMTGMFQNASLFDQNISDWILFPTVNLSRMFHGAQQFDQELGTWNIDSVSSMVGIFDSSGLSIEIYDRTLMDWEARPNLASISIGAEGLEYCTADLARSQLITRGWIFNGDTLNCLIVDLPKETLKEDSFEVFPNPSQGVVNINVKKAAIQNNKIVYSIYDSNAKLVQELALQSGSNQIDLSNYPNGLYFIRSNTESKKLMLLR